MAKDSIFTRFPKLLEIPEDKFPRHIFIIPDGNGRWAKKNSKLVWEGHKKGAEVVKKILSDLEELTAVKVVTVWGFSSDNWKRSVDEVKHLMQIFTFVLKNTLVDIKKKNKQFIHLGRKDRLPKDLINIIEQAENDTKNNQGSIISLAIDFSGEDQELRILKKAQKLEKNVEITQNLLWQLRDGKGEVRDADLLIRTSNEKRTSDVGWLNGKSTELYFIDKLFPDITTTDIVDAIIDFSKRERRFGGR